MLKPDLEFVLLLQRYQGVIHKICRAYCPVHEDRQDLFQEIAVQIWRAYPHFRGEAKESTWVYRVALNVAITGIRRKQPNLDELTEKMHSIPFAEESEHENTAMLYRAIQSLTAVEKALVLLYFEDKTVDEISALTGITPGNIRVKMHRIREKLRQLLQKQK